MKQPPLAQALAICKKDNLIWVPAITFFLLIQLAQTWVIPERGPDLNLTDCILIFAEVSAQGVLSALIALLFTHLRIGSTLKGGLTAFLNRVVDFIKFSIVIHLPLLAVLYVGIFYVAVDAEAVSTGSAVISLLFFLLTGLFLVPFSAFLSFSVIDYIQKPAAAVKTAMTSFSWCFKHYKVCLRWFWIMFSMNLIQLFLLPLAVSNFPLKQTIIAIVQGVITTLIMAYSIIYYEGVREKEALEATKSALNS